MLAEISRGLWVVIVLTIVVVVGLVVLYLLAKFSMLPRLTSRPDREPPPDPKAGVPGRIRDQTHRRYPQADGRD